jgi:hypothetical protein
VAQALLQMGFDALHHKMAWVQLYDYLSRDRTGRVSSCEIELWPVGPLWPGPEYPQFASLSTPWQFALFAGLHCPV